VYSNVAAIWPRAHRLMQFWVPQGEVRRSASWSALSICWAAVSPSSSCSVKALRAIARLVRAAGPGQPEARLQGQGNSGAPGREHAPTAGEGPVPAGHHAAETRLQIRRCDRGNATEQKNAKPAADRRGGSSRTAIVKHHGTAPRHQHQAGRAAPHTPEALAAVCAQGPSAASFSPAHQGEAGDGPPAPGAAGIEVRAIESRPCPRRPPTAR